MNDRTSHWENIYATKKPEEVSWTQDIPAISLRLIHSLNPDPSAMIIDIGGGDSKLVDFLLQEGFQELSVLDISQHALDRAKERIGEPAANVHWIHSDITAFEPSEKYDIWHDRAAFHFLTEQLQVETYLKIARKALKPGAYFIIGTFSTSGPLKCSGLGIRQYDEESMTATFAEGLEKISCERETHTTPFQTTQDFIFCIFKRI